MPKPSDYTPARRYIMQGVMWLILAGTIALAAVTRLMIVRSSNLATNILIEKVGAQQTSAFLQELGVQGVTVVRGIEDNVAHWAHLGGFILGVVLGLLLLITRLVNCRSGDILSGIFGRYAWPLVGRPDSSRKSIIAGWF
jgi:hypothetical protein